MKPLSALLAVSLVFLAQDTRAQQSSSSCELQVAATVYNYKTNAVIRGLSEAAFAVRSGRSKVPPKLASLAVVNRVFILVDVSGSIIESRAIDYARRATDELLSTVPENIPVIVMPFAEEFETIEQRKLVAPILEKLASSTNRPPGKSTHLYDTLVAVAQAQQFTMSDAVIVISDFDDNTSRKDRETVEKIFRSRGVRPTLILLPNQLNEPSEVEAWFNDAQYFAKNTAGFYISFPRSMSGAKPIVPAIFYEQALGFYRLTFPAGSIPKKHVKVTVSDSLGKRMSKVEVRASDALQVCQP
jgi:hypothetical protein